MSNTPVTLLPDELRNLLNEGLLARNAELTQQIAELTARCESLAKQVEELTREKNRNSSNSNKPPSSDNLGDRRKIRKPQKPTGRNCGGQPGHEGHYRKLLPLEQVNRIVDVFPDWCEVCQQVPPRIPQAKPWRHQVVDLLKDGGGRWIDEYHCHEVRCTCGALLPAPLEK